MLLLKISIKGQLWEVYALSNKAFDREHSKHAQAITVYHHDTNIRQMFFRITERSRSTIVHELIHAYLSYRDFSRTSYGGIEEAVCELLGNSYNRLSTNLFMIEAALRRKSFLRRSRTS